MLYPHRDKKVVSVKETLLHLTVVVISIILPFNLSAQNSSGTPYSMYGFGLSKDNYGPYTSMGGVSAAMRDNTNINFLNPASYTALDSNRFYFQFGLAGEYVRISTHTESSSYRVAQNAAMNMALRLFNKGFASFGFNQRTDVGYDLYFYKLINGADKEYYNQHVSGLGGLNDIYLGLGYQLGNLSVGVNSSLVFGNIERRLSLYPIFTQQDNNYYYINSQNKISVGDVLFDFGLQYKFRVTPSSKLTLGSVFNLETRFNADKTYIAYKVNASTSVQEVLEDEDLNEGNIKYPFKITSGLAYEYKEKWIVSGDYTFHQMSKYKEFKDNMGFKDYHKGAVGFSYVPAKYGRYWWQRNSYNIGLYGVRSQLKLKDTYINTLGVTFGTQMPMTITNRELLLGIAFDFGVRGTERNGLVREQYARLRLNIAFKEGWFMKRKIY